MDETNYTVLMTYQVGQGYTAEPLEQLRVQLVAYTKQEAEEKAIEILKINPAIERYIINVFVGHIS